MVRRLLLVLFSALGFFVLYQGTASAADFTVNNNGDATDANPGNGVCATAGGVCTLRAAVVESNAQPSADSIVIPAMQIQIGSVLTLSQPVSISGAGARSTVVRPSAINVALLNITGAGQYSLADFALQDVSGTAGSGYAFRQDGGLATLSRMRIHNNRATGSNLNAPVITYGTASLKLFDSEVSGNVVESSGLEAYGGAITLGGTSSVEIRNSTVSGNRATSSGSGHAWGGGVFTFGGTTLQIIGSTIAGNSATGPNSYGGNIYLSAGTTSQITDSVVSGGTANPNSRNCGGLLPVFTSRNIIGDTSCGTGGAARTIADPQLGPLTDNGGQTNTHALGLGSPAIDSALACPAVTDQRGQQRPIGAACDLGAVEVGADLAISQTISNPAPKPDSDVVLNVVATNGGLDDATDTSVQVDISGAGQVISATPAQGTCSISGGTVACSVGTTKRDAPVAIPIVVRAPQSGTITSIASTSSVVADPVPGNNSATVGAAVPGGTVPDATVQPCAVLLTGTPKADRLRGSSGGDRIRARGGNDTLKGRGGADCLLGQAGNDRLVGGSGDDRIVGGTGRDRVGAGAGADVVRVRDGVRDIVTCGAGKDLVVADRSDRVSRDCEKIRRK